MQLLARNMDFLFGFKSVHVFSGEITLQRWKEWKGGMEEEREGGTEERRGKIFCFSGHSMYSVSQQP